MHLHGACFQMLGVGDENAYTSYDTSDVRAAVKAAGHGAHAQPPTTHDARLETLGMGGPVIGAR